jgi:general secretion pathway protein I
VRTCQPPRGFTLLEVLVAIAILGLGLTVVLSAQTGVFWSYSRSRHLSQAPGQLRCKMAEIELDLLKLGYPLLDETDEGPCCDDEFTEGYTCEWKVQKVELPELPLSDPFGGGDADGGTTGAPPGMAGAEALTALAGLQQGGAAAGGGQVGDIAEMMGSGASVGGIAPMVMGLVYPDLKPMLESSIRKITVSVKWEEGSFERELVATQYVTSPQQGGFDPLAAEGLADTADQVISDVLGGAGVEQPATEDK